MTFAHPRVLWFAMALMPLLALFFWYTWMRRQELIAQFVQNRTLAQLAVGVSAVRQKWRRAIVFVAAGCLLLAMAGPQFGFTWEEAAQKGRDIVVAIDTSRSMLATDVQPDRLTRAKLAALDLLKLGKFDRFGLIAFSGSAFLQCPLTFDDEAFRQSVQILEPGIIPQGGTALSQAIRAARDAFGGDAGENHKILIIFSDGEDHEAQVTEEADRAAGEGVRIFTVGVGTPGGELLKVRDERGNMVYVKDEEGNVVKSRLNEQLLRQIATTGKGFYLPLQGGNAMDVLYQKGLAPLPTSERSSKLMKHLKEQFYWPLGFGILLLILEVFLSDEKRVTRKGRGAKKENAMPNPAGAAAPAAAVLFFLFFTPQLQASTAKAQRFYRAGEYKNALAEYQKLIEQTPDDSRLRYNAGVAAYQAKKFEEAAKQFRASAGARDLDLQQEAFYNLGNAEWEIGKAEQDEVKLGEWKNAIEHYDLALKLNPADKDAKENRDLVKKAVEELEKKQQKDKKQQGDNKDDKKDDSKDEKKKDDQKQQKQDNKSEQEKNDEQKDNKSEQDKQNQKNQQGQDNQEQQKRDEQRKKDEQEKEQGKNSQASQEKKDQKDKQDQASAQQGGQKENPQQQPEGDNSAAQYAQLGKMSPAQAKQLLDAQRSEEKALLFIPPDRKGTPQNRGAFKDW